MVIGFILLFILLFPSIVFGWGYLIVFITELKREWSKPTEEEMKQEIFSGMDRTLKKVSDEVNQRGDAE